MQRPHASHSYTNTHQLARSHHVVVHCSLCCIRDIINDNNNDCTIISSVGLSLVLLCIILLFILLTTRT